ncbi:MAG: 50S ribosomal protein L21 [Bacteroidia bacterium]|nr:50S ribosomal protein L21 [Bacteroidia bacterium]
MYAIVEIAGQQFKVEEGKKIFVHRLEVEEGNQIEFDQVLLIENDGKITIGEPTIKDAVVEGKILDHMRGDKVIVFKKKRKKGYRVKNGHRQNFTQVEIVSINGKASPKKATPKKEEVKLDEVKVTEETPKGKKAAEKKPAVKKPAVKKDEAPAKKASEKKVAEKKVAEKKPAVKKPVAKKPVAKKPAKEKE